MARTLDVSALTTAISPTDVKAFRERARTDPTYASQSGIAQIIGLVVVIFIVIVMAVMGAGFVALGISTLASAGAGPLSIVMLIVPVIFLGVLVLVVVFAVRSIFGTGGRWERWARLDRFARANGLVFSPSDANPQYPGAIFTSGSSRESLDHVRTPTDRFVDYGNYRYVTGSGKNRTTHNWGFLALQLDRSLPHMVLDSKANNGLFGGTNLPAFFNKDQVLALEGNFNQYFTLYCPKEYERDALYVFTPDLMALLIDQAAPFDVEIIDKWMFVYSSVPFDLRQPALHERLFRIIDTVGTKTLSQTDRYTDERVANFSANVVAPQGQRLKRGVSIGAIIFIALFVGLWAWPFIAELVGFFAISSR